MSIREIYRSKLKTVDEALSLISSGDIIAASSYGGEPYQIMSGLHRIAGKVRDVELWTCNQRTEFPFYSDPDRIKNIKIHSIFFGPQDRAIQRFGNIDFHPLNLHVCARTILANGTPNVFISTVPPMDDEGYFYLSPSIQYEYECCEAASVRIFEVNPNAPRLYGKARYHISEISAVVEADNEISSSPEPVLSDLDRAIAANVASLIHDGDTLQIGIGNTPFAIGEALMSKHDLGIHTEMLCNPLGKLIECGAVNNSKKTLHPGRSVCGFAWGSRQFYDFINDRDDIEIMPSSYVNDPAVIRQVDNMTAINAALQIDLTGQVCSETINSIHYSGTGGAADFVEGAYESRGGKSIFAITSTTKGGTLSRIVPMLGIGSAVSIPRNLVDYVVTEYGAVSIKNASLRERARRLISVAHPDFRKDLEKQAKELLLW